MANYNNLLSTIAANAKAGNNNHETSAQNLEDAMDSMVAVLGAGYQYMGVATTSTNPNSPDAKYFYIATKAGTYTHFTDSNNVALEVNDGEVAILYGSGTSWSKKLSGAATSEVVSALAEYASVYSFTDVAASNVEAGKRFDSNGVIQTAALLSLYTFPVTGGNQYAFSGRFTSAITYVYFIAWYDSNDVYISREDYQSSTDNPQLVEISRKVVTAPVNAAYAKMNVQTSQASYVEFLSAQSITLQDFYGDAIKDTDVVDGLGSFATNAPLSANQGRILNDSILNEGFALREKTYTPISEDNIDANTRCLNGVISSSNYMDLYTFNGIDPTKIYVFSGKYGPSIDIPFIAYYDANGVFISHDTYKGGATATIIDNALLHIPSNAVTIKMNVSRTYRTAFSLSSVVLGDYYPFSVGHYPLKVVVNSDKSFYVRFGMDDTNDGILTFDYFTAYAYDHNCIMQSRFFIGSNDMTDNEILAQSDYQSCRDSQSPMFTANFGPMFSNHGYSTPRVNIPGHGLVAGDVGSEWYDQNNYHYTIGNISGNWIYLLPVIDTTGGAGHETRGWKWYASDYPTQITRNIPGGTTLQVSNSSRWDYQVSELNNVRVLINGQSVDAGTYYAKEVELAYKQIGYNPVNIQTWWPDPVYNGIMLEFDRHFTITGGKGSLSLTSNTIVNNNYPYPLYHYVDVVPQFPFQIGNYVPYVYIPKMLKVISDIDFREEFASPDGSHSAVVYRRNASDLVDVDDMPDRAYTYLKDGNDDILYGCAGGHSLVRGMSVKSVRNQYIAMNDAVGTWNPPAGNKFYNNVLLTTGEQDNILPASFIGEFEGYMCWYKPTDGVHTFYHRTKEGYAVYIHTNTTQAKGAALLPDWMNNMAVTQTIEKTDGISLLTNTITDGRLFFSSDSSVTEYNYIVIVVN